MKIAANSTIALAAPPIDFRFLSILSVPSSAMKEPRSSTFTGGTAALIAGVSRAMGGSTPEASQVSSRMFLGWDSVRPASSTPET